MARDRWAAVLGKRCGKDGCVRSLGHGGFCLSSRGTVACPRCGGFFGEVDRGLDGKLVHRCQCGYEW